MQSITYFLSFKQLTAKEMRELIYRGKLGDAFRQWKSIQHTQLTPDPTTYSLTVSSFFIE